jgi:hypothetical protein
VPQKAPGLEAVALVAPKRTGRQVVSLEEVLKSAEVRLRLAWAHRKTLDPALPTTPPFHAHAWTALNLLKSRGATSAEAEERAQNKLERLLAVLVRLRKIVALTTHPDDPAREPLGFGRVLRASRALVEEGKGVIDGARKVRAQFPAITEALLDEAAVALQEATVAVEKSKADEISSAVKRGLSVDERQLALDVLLDSIDHLRAAAIGVLAASKPKLAEMLAAPLESRSKADDDEDEAPPAPEPGGGS